MLLQLHLLGIEVIRLRLGPAVSPCGDRRWVDNTGGSFEMAAGDDAEYEDDGEYDPEYDNRRGFGFR